MRVSEERHEFGIPVRIVNPPIFELDLTYDLFVIWVNASRGSGPENDIFSSSPKIIFECSNLLF